MIGALNYITHKMSDIADIENAKKIARKLNIDDGDNTYICAWSALALEPDDIDCETYIEMRKDLLIACDRLVVVGKPDRYMQEEIDLATLISMEVIYLNEAGNQIKQ